MRLLNPIMMLGIALCAIPILIHLLNRTRYRVEPFGAMLFLRAAVKVRAQTLKLQQLLLLLLRCLFFALLALALARPMQTPTTGGGGQQPTTHIILIDGSLSMQQQTGNVSAFDQARTTAERLIRELPTADNMAIVWGGSRPRPLAAQLTYDKTYLAGQLQSLAAGFETIDVPSALEQAFWLLATSTLPRHRIYLLTDGQAYGWQASADARWEQIKKHFDTLKVKPSIYVLPQGPEEQPDNLAPVSLSSQTPLIDVFRPAKFSVDLMNHSAHPIAADINFSVDGEVRATRAQTLPPGPTTLHFDHLFAKAGSHYLSVEVGPDEFEVDNTLTHAVQVLDQVPVLIIEQHHSQQPWTADGHLLNLALAAVGGPGEAGLFSVTRRPAADMDAMDTAYLSRFKTVGLANVPSLSEYFLFALERFVEQGGGLLIGLGDDVVAEDYARIFKSGRGLLPAELLQVKDLGNKRIAPTFPAGKARFVLDVFDLSRTRRLPEVKVAKFWACRPVAEATVLANLDEDPLLILKPHGDGRCILWTTTLNAKWTNFPLTRDYLPLVQNLVTYLSASIQPPIALTTGDALVYAAPLSPTAEGAESMPELTLLLPDGEPRQFEVTRRQDEWTATWDETSRPGLYTVRSGDGVATYFSVSGQADESNLRVGDSDFFAKAAARCPMFIADDELSMQEQIATETGGREWWKRIICMAIILLCGELVFSWRFS